MGELIKETAKKVTDKEVMQKLSLHMRSSNIATEFVSMGFKKQRTRISKSLDIFDKKDSEDTNIYAPNIDRFENCPDNLDDIYLADFTASYAFEKADMSHEPDDEKSYIESVAEIDE